MKKKSKSGKKAEDSEATSELIRLQTEAFLSGGGEIDVIKPGLSGIHPQKGKNHITITGSKHKR